MMRKLAVTVFVVSLAALGCGSDSGTPNKPDTAVPGIDGPAAKTDGRDVALPTEAGPEVTTEAGQTTEAGAKKDVLPTEAGLGEAGTTLEVQKDTTPSTKLDGGVDSQPQTTEAGSVDTGAGVDGGALDVAAAG